MKITINLQNMLALLAAVLVFSVFIAFLIAGYNLVIGNFHQYVYL